MIMKDNNYKVMKVFFDSPEKRVHIRQISRLVGLSPPGILKIVKNLKKEGLLASERNGVVENVYASKTEKFFHLKLCYNLLALYESGLISFLRQEYEEPEAIVLFGSYAHAEDISASDVDVAVITGRNVSPDLSKFEKKLNRKINVYGIKIGECEKEFLNGLANGIVLHGFLRVV